MKGRLNVDISELRERINEADDRLLKAFEDRMRAARGIAEYKAAHGLPVYDEAREREVLARQTANASPDMRGYIARLYGTLFEISKDYQKGRIAPRYGLLGERLAHSRSPRLHELLGGEGYELWPTPPDRLDAFMRARDFDGLNVTIPYKRAVLPYVDELSETARRVGCVNTIVKRADGTLYGDNTDVYGFTVMARRAGIDFRGEKTLILGSGGAGLAVRDAVAAAGGKPVIISRSGADNYESIERHADAAYVVNATPVGMYPDVGASPLDLARLPRLRGVLDVIYNPLRTALIKAAEARGLVCAGGITMLVYQAARARELFTGEALPEERIREAESALIAEGETCV